jgi:hypothetical protein
MPGSKPVLLKARMGKGREEIKRENDESRLAGFLTGS